MFVGAHLFGWKFCREDLWGQRKRKKNAGCYLDCRMLLFKYWFRRWQHSHCKWRPWIVKVFLLLVLAGSYVLCNQDGSCDLNIITLYLGTDRLAMQGCKISNMVTADTSIFLYECHRKLAGNCSNGSRRRILFLDRCNRTKTCKSTEKLVVWLVSDWKRVAYVQTLQGEL